LIALPAVTLIKGISFMTNFDNHPLTNAQVLKAIANNDVLALRLLPKQLGLDHDDWQFIQDICVQLSEHPDETVRGNAFYGLAYTAMTLGKLDKSVVKPVILRGMTDNNEYVRRNAETAQNDINLYLDWDIQGEASPKTTIL
jgi:hypothetical protein